MPFLSEAQKKQFAHNGYLILPHFKAKADCEALLARAGALIEDFDADSHRVAFSTRPDQEAQRNAYFMDSAGSIRFFFEEEALDEAGDLICPKSEAINKVGHALHDLDPVFNAFSRDPRLAEICGDLGLKDPRLVQSMCICKQPRIGGEVRAHQDASYLYTEPESTHGMWFALEDATLENGCLWVLPGAHKEALAGRYIRGEGTSAEHENFAVKPWPEEAFVPVEVETGTLVLLHGYLPHKSLANRSGRSRFAYTLHILDWACRYLPGNWIRFPQDRPPQGF